MYRRRSINKLYNLHTHTHTLAHRARILSSANKVAFLRSNRRAVENVTFPLNVFLYTTLYVNLEKRSPNNPQQQQQSRAAHIYVTYCTYVIQHKISHKYTLFSGIIFSELGHRVWTFPPPLRTVQRKRDDTTTRVGSHNSNILARK